MIGKRQATSLSMWLQHRQKRLLITVGVVAVVAMWLTVLNRLSCAQPANTPHEVVLGTTKAGDASSLALAGSIEASKLKRKGPFQFNSRSIPLAPAPSTSPDAALTPVPPPAEPSSKWCVDPYPTENRWPSVQEEARDRYDHCRRGSQRCVEWSTATPFSRFPLLETSQWSTDTIAAGKEGTFDPRTRNQLQRMHGLLSATSDDPDAVSNAPYDIDGTPALRTRLREYLATHRAATDFESALAKIESDVASLADAQSVDAKETRARKFARWQKWIAAQRYLLNVDNESGFGNKMLPIISAFAYALLTGRHLILFFPVPGFKDLFTVGPTSPDPSVKPLVTDWNVFLEGLITVTRKLDPTYPVNERGEPKDTEDVDAAAHWTTSVQRRMAETGDTSKPQIKNFHEILALFPQTMLPAVAGGVEAPMYTQAPLDLQAPDSSQAQADMLCNDWLHSPSLTSAWLIRTWSDQYWLPLLAGNELVRPILLGWVNENNMYGPLARFFLNWSPLHVRQRADEFARAHFGTYNIGLQLRRKERVGLRRSEVAGALEGAKALAMLYLGGDPTESSLTPSDLLALRGRRRQVTFFIATDDFASREHWAGVLCPYGHVAFSPTLEYPRDEGTRNSGYYMPTMSTGAWDRTKRAAEDQLARLPIKFKEGLSWAVAENLLLSACDDVVLSPTSTYGYHAAGFGSLIPHRVLHEPNRQVYRVFSSEPQSHFWKPLMREVDRWKLCRVEEDLPARSQQEECCPRWDSEFDTEGPNHARGPGLEQALKDHETKWKGRIEQKKAQEEAAKAELAAKNGVKA